MRNSRTLLSALLLSISIILLAQTDPKLRPSEVYVLMRDAVDNNPREERIAITKPYMSRAIKTDLSDIEQFYLAELHFWNFMPDKAHEIYSKFLTRDDSLGRACWQRVLQIEFVAYEKAEKVERAIEEFRNKFSPQPRDELYMFGQVYNVGNKYAQAGDHQKVLDLVNNELDILDYEWPYKSYLLPVYFFSSYKELGETDLAIKLLKDARAGLQKKLDKRKETVLDNDPDFARHSERVEGMNTIMTTRLSYNQSNEKFEDAISKMNNYIQRMGQAMKKLPEVSIASATRSIQKLPWTLLSKDQEGDASSSNVDGKSLSYHYNQETDTLYFKFELFDGFNADAPAISVALDIDSNQENGIKWYGSNKAFKVDLMLSFGPKRDGEKYFGYNGITDAIGIKNRNWINIKQGNLRFYIDNKNEVYYLAVKKNDFAPYSTSVNLIGSVGSNSIWSDDIGKEGTYSTIEFVK